ncbi:MAG: ribosome biogenesis GTPase Der, partial [Planctomycetota bacterium]
MTLPVVAIVGRPNVGKSSLFNCLAKRRIAIVDPTSGVTRDRVVSPVSWRDTTFDLTDTGGMGVEDVDNLTDDIERQIRIGMEQAHVLIFLVDARAGLTPLDQRVAEKLRTLNKPVILVANKCDVPEVDQQSVEFYRLGFGDPICVSAQHARNRDKLLDMIQSMVPIAPAPPDPVLKLAIVGRRNTGKSTFINALAGQERVIVSEVAGTTRDSIDVRFEKDGMALLAIDTAGVRKRRSVKEDIEFYSLARAQRSIRRADVVLLFLEPRMRISRVDK